MRATRKVGGRRRTPKQSSIVSIPQLRKSFDYLEEWVAAHINTAKIVKLVPEFQAEWKKLFHREIETPIAKAYLEIKARFQPPRRHQKGGGAMVEGAPLDYTTQPGVQGVYGNFPEYVSSGFSISPESFTAMCGKENTTPVIPATLGSNLVGGRRATRRRHTRKGKQAGGSVGNIVSSMTERLVPNTSPPTMGAITEMATKGVDVSVPTPANLTLNPTAYDPSAFKIMPFTPPPPLQIKLP